MANILFLMHRIPFPLNKGEKIRAWNILNHLNKTHTIHLGTFVDDRNDYQHVSYMESLFQSSCIVKISYIGQRIRALGGLFKDAPLSFAAYQSQRMHRYVNTVIQEQELDLIFVFSGAMGQFVPVGNYDIPVFFDLNDVDSQKWLAYGRTSRFPMRQLYLREASYVGLAEIELAQRFGNAVLVSQDEADLFKAILGRGDAVQVHAVSNGVDCEKFCSKRIKADKHKTESIIFSGAMSYRPNIEGVTWFARHVWPLLLQKYPDLKFIIAGGGAGVHVKQLENIKGIEVLGYVKDMAETVDQADIVVAPLLTARGIQNKVLEGMAMSKPVVASPEALEGVICDIGADIVCADGAEDFAKSILKLIEDPKQARMIGERGRACVERHYSWESTFEKLDNICNGLMNKKEKGLLDNS